MIKWYNKQGEEITDPTEAEKLFSDPAYKIIEQTTLPNGKWVSTVWLGLSHQYGDGPPLIFETMVFKSKDAMGEEDMERYSTEEEAKEGHKKMVEKWTNNSEHD